MRRRFQISGEAPGVSFEISKRFPERCPLQEIETAAAGIQKNKCLVEARHVLPVLFEVVAHHRIHAVAGQEGVSTLKLEEGDSLDRKPDLQQS